MFKTYDIDKAKIANEYMARIALRFFQSTGPANIPILGELLIKNGLVSGMLDGVAKIAKRRGMKGVQGFFGGKADLFAGSLAQRLYKNKAGTIWHAADQRKFIENLLFNKGMITEDAKDGLLSEMAATRADVYAQGTGVITPMLSLVILLYVLKKASEDV